jgi:hypothetical protein
LEELLLTVDILDDESDQIISTLDFKLQTQIEYRAENPCKKIYGYEL